jgi:ATP-binding cassette subfamily B protein
VIFRIFVYNTNAIVAANITADLSALIFFKSITQDFAEISKQHSSIFISGTNEKMSMLNALINQLLTLFSGLILALGIVIYLIIFNYKITFLILFFYLFFYLLLVFFTKNFLSKYSKIVTAYTDAKIKVVQESLGNIRDIIINSTHKIYINYFNELEKKLRKSLAKIAVISYAPKFLVEGIGISLLIIISFSFYDISPGKLENKDLLLINLSIFAFAAQKLMPLMQNIYQSWASMSGYIGVVENLIELLNRKSQNKFLEDPRSCEKKQYNKISYENVSFRYLESDNYIFKNLSCEIMLGQKIGIKGRTGSGKSTFVDLFLGLLCPTNGKIFVNNEDLQENLHSFRRDVAYVPQNIFLLNDTIKNNITINADSIDKNLLLEVCNLSCLSDFIEKLPDGINTKIGENSSNISGGQKQRIGIARALYKNKKILILDEATNALDKLTEKKIIKQLTNSNTNTNTLLMISHDDSNFTEFDTIINIDNFTIKKTK